MDLLKNKLEDAGLNRFECVLEDDDVVTDRNDDVVRVKTLIWEALFQRYLDKDYKGEGNIRVVHFATALRYKDRVDEEKLQEELLRQQQQQQQQQEREDEEEEQQPQTFPAKSISTSNTQYLTEEIINLHLAETTKAEQLTGYMSGTIPPLGHITPMPLIVDQALIDNINKGVDNAAHNDGRTQPRKILSTGSGSFRHSLRISMEDLLEYAENLTAGVWVASISIPSSSTLPKPLHKSSCHNSNVEQSHGQFSSDLLVDKDLYLPCAAIPVSDEIKSLAKLLRDAVLRKGKANIIRTVISQAGDRFPELFQVGTEVNYSRNAMHLAAWKGDLESIELLIEAGKQYGLDLVNNISTGEGNYGKTPIFYAINQGRNDVIRLFIDRGADLLIRNRNGNTPCELANGRVQPETCELLRQVETKQIQSGRSFRNFMVNARSEVKSVTCTGRAQVIPSIEHQNEQKQESRNLKSLSKKLRDSAGKRGKFEIVRSIIEEVGDDFRKLVEVGTDGNFTKNALHLAAWKGDLESIEHLIAAGLKYNMDLVNVISRGEGNYGKTPIFYAITQDRDDAVKLFLDRGANLLIVNNKGQTPCSMSVTHLQPETCELMFQKEFEQIQSGGDFLNYRLSHCDNKQYGDLDPRFEIDEVNYGVDIVADVGRFEEAVTAVTNPANKHVLPRYKLLPASFQPRSLRPTTKASRQSRAERFRLSKSLCAQKVKGSKLPPARKVLEEAIEEEKENNVAVPDSEAKPQIKFSVERVDQEEQELENLPQLYLSDVLISDDIGNDIVVIKNENGVAMLAEEVSKTVALSLQRGQIKDASSAMDSHLVELSWGLDCEWKPSRDRGRENPVATLQLSSSKKAFLVDMQEICQQGVKDQVTEMNGSEKLLCNVLAQIFEDPQVPIVGFGIGQDLAKLAVSYPHMPCFHGFHAIIDLDALFHNSFFPSRSKDVRSLQNSVVFLLQKRLDKTEQCSNWQQRPLTMSQVEYATLDAAVLPRLLREALRKVDAGCIVTNTAFFAKHPHLLVSWRITILDQNHIDASVDPRCAFHVEHGTSKKLLNLWYARQTWQTGKEKPASPVPINVEDQLMAHERRKEDEAKKLESKQKAKVQRQLKHKKKALKLTTLSVDTLPPLGQYLGYTKEQCILKLLEDSVLDSLAETFYLGFNRRGGIIQMKDTWLLFVNFGAGTQNRKFKNKFSGRGRFITFSVDPRKDLDGQFYDEVSVGYHGQETPNLPKDCKLLLFARPDNGSQYLFCGRCLCAGEEASGGNIDLLLELLNFDALDGTPYSDMVEDRCCD